MSLTDNPEVNPSLWFVGDAGLEWVVIRAVRYPENEAPRPANFATIQQTFEARGFKGYFASVAFADSRQADASSDEPMPLCRGCGMYVTYGGITEERALTIRLAFEAFGLSERYYRDRQ